MTDAKILGATLALLAAFGTAAEAKLYKWVDEKGETHYGEVIPPEYANRDKVQFNEKGREVKKKEAADGTDANKKVLEEKQETIDRQRKDKALVSTYSNEQEIDLARDRNLQQVEARINSAQLLLKSAQESLNNFLHEADELKRGGKKIPDSLQADIAGGEKKVAKLKEDLAKAQEKAASVKASYEADKERYRELTGSSKK